MIKCKKCNSTNVKVDFSKVYTSLPAMYEYKCQDCGYVEYVNYDEVNMGNFDKNGLLNVEREKNLNNTDAGYMLGWICPKCGRCYSPFTSMCSFCNNDGYNHITVTY